MEKKMFEKKITIDIKSDEDFEIPKEAISQLLETATTSVTAGDCESEIRIWNKKELPH